MGRSTGLIDFTAATRQAEQGRVWLYDRADNLSAPGGAPAPLPVEHPTLFVRDIEWRQGALPGRARFTLDTLDRIDPGPQLSFRAAGGAIDLHRVGRRVTVKLSPGDLPLFHGTLVHRETDLAADRIEFTALDDRWLLTGVPLYGCIVASPLDGTLTYAQGWPLIFNPDGLKNCRDVNGRPVFTHTPEWNAPAATDESPAPGEAAAAARHWTVADILQYLRFAYFDPDSAALFADFPWMLRANAFATQLDWPADFHAALTAGDPADPQDALNKTPRHLVLDGLDLCTALEQTLRAAGPCSFDLRPAENGLSRLALTITDLAGRTAADDDGVIDLPRPLYLASQDTAAADPGPPPPGLVGGVHHLDLESAYESTVTLGDRVRLEARFAQTSATTGDLLPAWDSAEETDFKNYLAAAGDPVDGLHSAMRRWPRVGQAYRLNPAAAALDAGGVFAALARIYCSRTPDPVLASIDPTPDTLKRVLRLPITVEAQEIGGAGTWHPALIADGLTIDAQGSLYLPGLLLADGNASNHNGVFDIGLQFRNLRINCAVPLDHALTYVVAAADAELALPANPGEPAGETQGFGGGIHVRAPRAAAWIAPGLRRQHCTRTRNQYRHDYRYEAWPVPATAGGSSQTGLYRSDLDALARAASESARALLEPRIAFAPELAGITPALRPGLVIRRIVEETDLHAGHGVLDTTSTPLTAAGPTPAAPLTPIDAVIHRVIFDFTPKPRTRLFST